MNPYQFYQQQLSKDISYIQNSQKFYKQQRKDLQGNSFFSIDLSLTFLITETTDKIFIKSGKIFFKELLRTGIWAGPNSLGKSRAGITFLTILGANKNTMQFNEVFHSYSRRVKHAIFLLILFGITQWEPYQGLLIISINKIGDLI